MHAMLWKTLLTIHVAGGFGAFLLAPIPLATAKGGRQHKRWGMVYLWSMGIMALTAIPLALFRPILFLALVAVFSFYLAFSAYRILRLKDLPSGGRPGMIDWIAALVTLASSAWLVWLSLVRPGSIQVFWVVGVAFGLIGVRAAAKNLWMFVRPPKAKMFWLYAHLEGFLGSYVAAWSAFSAVTLTQVLGNHWYVWLWPTIVGVPAITITSALYQRKFAPRREVAAVEQHG